MKILQNIIISEMCTFINIENCVPNGRSASARKDFIPVNCVVQQIIILKQVKIVSLWKWKHIIIF